MDQTPHYKDEFDWKDLLRKPEKLFGYSYIYILVVFIGIGLLYVGNLNSIGRNLIHPQVLLDSSQHVQDLPLQSPRTIPPIEVTQASISTPAMIEKGHQLFKTNCASCHGETGLGDGPSAVMLTPKPRNFHSLSGWTNGSKISQIYKTLEEGIAGSGMASYNYLTPEDRFAVIHYIRTFAHNQPDDNQDALKQLDATYQLSKGMNIQGQIPVKKALRLVEQESVPSLKQVHTSVLRANASHAPGAEIFERVVDDETKVMMSAENMHIKNISENDFIKIVTADPIGLGYKTSIIRLSGSEWSSLYHFVYSTIQEDTIK
jgi:mono/diheme cytochrome c family protein